MKANLLKIREVAAALNVSYNAVLGAVKCGKLKAYRFGPRKGTYRIDPADLAEYMKNSVAPVAEERKSERPKNTKVLTFTHLNADRLLDAWRAKEPDGELR